MAFLLKRQRIGSLADAGILGSEESRSQTFLWQEQDSISRGFGKASWGVCCYSRVALLWFPKLEPRSDGAGWAENSTRAGLSERLLRGCTGPQGPSRSPILAGKGIARGQLFTVKESPFLASPASPRPCSVRRTGTGRSLAGPSTQAAETHAQHFCRRKSKSLSRG